MVFVCQAEPTAGPPLPHLPAAIAALEKETRVEMERTGVPGVAIAIVHDDILIYAQGFGLREAGKPETVTPETVFQLASISKPVGSTVIASLVGQGVVGWDSKIAELDPSFALFDPAVTAELTIGDLYSHRSGLPGHIGDRLEDIGFSREEILHRLRHQPLAGTFRASYAYTNFGLTQAAVAAAKKAGQSWEDVSQKLLYEPLGMTSTSSTFADFQSRENRASGHQKIDGQWIHREQRQPEAQTPAGGVSSSVLDMAKWMRLQLAGGLFEGKRIVDEKALATSHRPQMTTDTGGKYGYGWNVGTEGRLSHSGAFALGAATFVLLAPAEKLGIIILTNGEPIGLAETLGTNFLDNAVLGKPSRDWNTLFRDAFQAMHDEEWAMSRQYDVPPENPAPSLAPAAYEGTYENRFHGPARVVARDGKLVLLLGPKEKPFPLTPWDGNAFTFVTGGEMGAGRSGVFFTVEDGGATGMRIEFFDRNKNGAFTRTTR